MHRSSRRKICVVITARPSYSRVKTVLQAIKDDPGLELQVVAAASALLDRYGKASDFIAKDGFEITAKVFNVLEGGSVVAAAKTTGLGILELSGVFEQLRPDIVVTIADRFETMSTAIAASYMNIPLAHIQGGEVSGNIDEKVRHAITKLSDYHFVCTEGARTRVVRMGEEPEYVFNTGCPSVDLAARVKGKRSDFDPFERYGGVGEKFGLEDGYIVVMQHPVTTEVEQSRIHVEETLEAIRSLDLPTFWFWPNVDAGSDGTSRGIRAFREKHHLPKVHFFKNMEPEDFLSLLLGASCLVGNSSVGIRECSFLGVPVVNIGSRQHRRERGSNVVDVENSSREIQDAIRHSIDRVEDLSSELYGDGKSGVRIADKLRTLPLKFHKTITY